MAKAPAKKTGPVIIDCEQGSDEWKLARAGIPTASRFKDMLAGGDGKVRSKYMRQLAGEILTREPMETYENHHMIRGRDMEARLLEDYAFTGSVEIERVGFIRNGEKGCSPDGLVGKNGLVQIKSTMPDLLIEIIEKGEPPTAHYAQCQGELWVTDREWVDLVIGYTGMPSFKKRLARDEMYIRKLADAHEQFLKETHELVERIRRFADPTRARKK